MFYPLDAHARVPIPLNPRDKTILATEARGHARRLIYVDLRTRRGADFSDGGVQTAWVSMYHIRPEKAR
jgi:hypothetical protein